MKVFLAGVFSLGKGNEINDNYVLESFYSFPKTQIQYLPRCKEFILDSGAFTFLNQKKVNVDLNKYVDDYIAFINENNIKHFFELDVDSLKGLKYVEDIRRELKIQTGRDPIPVWHKSRGMNYFKTMCEEFDYVSIGGIVTKELTQKDYPKFLPMIKYAHLNHTKIHGLGFTNMKWLHRLPFDSVDSTNWGLSTKFGLVFKFDERQGKMVRVPKPEGTRITSSVSANTHNLKEWGKFQRYAENNL